MKLKKIEAYWKFWSLKEAKGNPFSFLREDQEREEDQEEEDQEEEDQEEEDQEEEDQEEDQEEDKMVEDQVEQEQVEEVEEEVVEEEVEVEEDQEDINRQPTASTQAFNIDSGVSLPCQCTTPAECTAYLQELVPKLGQTGKTFHVLVRLVDALKVSLMLIIIHIISHAISYIILGYRYSKWISKLSVAIHTMVMG